MKSIDEVRASFRFVGNAVNPILVTEKLGIEPSSAHAKGDIPPKHPGRVYPTGLWCLDSPLDLKCTIDEHLEYLIGVLEHKARLIAELQREGCMASLFCGFFVKQDYNSTIVLSPNMLRRIISLEIGLDIQIYCDCQGE